MIEVRSTLPPVAPMLDTEEGIATFLSEVLANGDSARLVEALKAVAWARVISHLALKLGMPRPHIAQMMAGAAPLTMDVMAPLLAEFRVKLAVTPTVARAETASEPPSATYTKRF